MYQRTAPHSPNGQVKVNLTAGPTDYEAGYFPVEFYFSSASRCAGRYVCGMSPMFIYKYTSM
jgi:hypothetical protein